MARDSVKTGVKGTRHAELVADIRANGLLEPVTLYEGKILDGRNRERACVEAGVAPRYREWSGEGSLTAFVVSLNLQRRHLTPSQRAMVALDSLPWLEEEAKERQKMGKQKIADPSTTGQARDEATRITHTNRQYVSDAKRIDREAPAIAEQVRAGRITIPQAKHVLPCVAHLLHSRVTYSHQERGARLNRIIELDAK
jgi:ParB-like chromosome segregation protein Spo0J